MPRQGLQIPLWEFSAPQSHCIHVHKFGDQRELNYSFSFTTLRRSVPQLILGAVCVLLCLIPNLLNPTSHARVYITPMNFIMLHSVS